MDYPSLNDPALIRLVVHGDTEALSVLYDRFSRLVYGLAYNTVGDATAAEEITQDVFVRVWEKAGTYRVEQAKVSTWLTSITRNRAIDVLRQRSSRPEQYSVSWDELNPGAEPSLDGPEGEAEQSLERQRIRNAVNALPPEQQRALALAYFRGLSHSEIAAALGEPLGTVKTRIRLAMQKLREVIRDDLQYIR